MNVGPGGFGHAKVTKGLVLATASASIFAQAARASHRQLPRGLAALSGPFAFTTPGELFFGALLLYNFRIIERQTGSKTYGSHTFIVTALCYAMRLVLHKLKPTVGSFPTGPSSLIFAMFVYFCMDVPALAHFRVLGWNLSDKWFAYIAGLQLLMSHGRRSVLLGVFGLLAGLIVRGNFLGLGRCLIPRGVTQLISQTVGAVLQDGDPPQVLGMLAMPSRNLYPGPQAHRNVRGPISGAHLGPGRGPVVPLAPAVPQPVQPTIIASPEAVEKLVAMGFDREQVVQALRQSNNDVQAAIAMLV